MSAKRFSIGEPVWVYERALYPVEATITKVVTCDLFVEPGEDTVMGYEVSKTESSALDGKCIAPHNIWRRPIERAQLLKELRDDIEFLESYVRELELYEEAPS